jgi:hypothetical protein
MVLGIIAGMIACFWTRIIKTNMIFTGIGRWLQRIDNNHVILTTRHSMLAKFLRCSICLQPWLMLVLALFYILVFNPWWLFCVIGVAGGLGSGNLVAEIVCSLRNEQ